MAPINFEPSFAAVAEIPGACGTSRWLAPEFMGDPDDGTNTPAMESCPADVFSFAMVAVEVFTDKVPFAELTNEAAMFQIAQGGRPQKPDNAQRVGLTDKVWVLLESCWKPRPEDRFTMEKVVGKWEKFVKHDDNDNNGCVQVTRVIQTLLSLPSLPFYN